MRSCLLVLMRCVLLVVAGSPLFAQQKPVNANQEANVKAYVELLRSDLRQQRVAILTEMMELTDREASVFWPMLTKYDKELQVIGDERIAYVRMYADNHDEMTDAKITEIANGFLDLETRRIQLRKAYFQSMSKALSPKLAARFLQIESQLEKLVDLQVASELPVVE